MTRCMLKNVSHIIIIRQNVILAQTNEANAIILINSFITKTHASNDNPRNDFARK